MLLRRHKDNKTMNFQYVGNRKQIGKNSDSSGAKYVENFQQREKLIDHTFDTIDIGIE